MFTSASKKAPKNKNFQSVFFASFLFNFGETGLLLQLSAFFCSIDK